jgi:tartrate dehydratase alpha subunit/fumarate hydratase class I-like protein
MAPFGKGKGNNIVNENLNRDRFIERMANEFGRPCCQDTGVIQYFVQQQRSIIILQ